MEEQKIPIEIDSETAGGRYSNVAVITHSENEFAFDFIFAHPPRGRVNARIIMSPAHAKSFLEALQKNIELYEKKAGPIKKSTEPPEFGIEFSKN
jgi:hypothetical protein